MKPKVVTALEFEHDYSVLVLGTPEGLRWYAPEKLLPPREFDTTHSRNLWLALSDGRVVRGYASFFMTGSVGDPGWGLHSWSYYENAQGGLAPRYLSRAGDRLRVEAWSFTTLPEHPLR